MKSAERLTFDVVRTRAGLDEYDTDVLLRAALENAAGLEGHPKAELLFKKARDGSDDVEELVHRYQDMSELLT